jgi:cytochrome P450
MQSVANLALPYLPAEQPEFAANPMPFIEAARRQHPWLAKIHTGYFVHGYRAVKDLMIMDDKLRPGFDDIVDFYQAQGTPWGRFMQEIVIARTGVDHARLRASIAAAFTPRQANLARPLMRKVISDLLDEWAPKGEFDFALFASYFPVAVMCGLLGVSAAPIPSMRTALENQITSVSLDPAMRSIFLESYDVIWKFADSLVLGREESGHREEGALLDALIKAKASGQMDGTELRFMVMTLLLAGYDTSKNMLTVTMQMMLDRPEMWERCAVDKAFCGKVVEEMLRLSSISSPFRVVADDFIYDDVLLPKGTMIIFALPLTGRDADAFSDPMRFDPDRVSPERHMAFGRGEHMCPGQFVAKNQLQEGLHLIAQRLTKPRLVGKPISRQFLGVWGLQTLPIAFTPGDPPTILDFH